MVVGEIAEAVDLLVVGAGPGGYQAALHAAARGREVTLVDQHLPDRLGGVCLHEGCIPSKLLIEAASRVAGAQSWSQAGVVGDLTFDPAAFQRYRHTVEDRLAKGIGALLAARRVHTRQGRLRFTRPGAAVLHTSTDQAVFLEYRDAIIATGSQPVALPGLPFNGTSVMDSAGVLRLTRLPGSLVVIGGGYIGLELGTALAKLGVSVTIVEQADQLLPGVSADLLTPVLRRLRQLRVQVHLSSTVTGQDRDGELRISGAAGERRLAADAVLVSVGRRANTLDLGLENLGITPHAGGLLPVGPDRRLTRHVAAIGDCTPGPALAHKAGAEAAVAVTALGGDGAVFDAVIPQVVFCDPPIAVTGITAQAAAAQDQDITVARFPLSALGRAVADDATSGFARLIADRQSGALLGAELVGTAAAELIGELTLAIEMGATAEDLALTVHPHPTYSEQLVEAAHLVLGTPLHSVADPALVTGSRSHDDRTKPA